MLYNITQYYCTITGSYIHIDISKCPNHPPRYHRRAPAPPPAMPETSAARPAQRPAQQPRPAQRPGECR